MHTDIVTNPLERSLETRLPFLMPLPAWYTPNPHPAATSQGYVFISTAPLLLPKLGFAVTAFQLSPWQTSWLVPRGFPFHILRDPGAGSLKKSGQQRVSAGTRRFRPKGSSAVNPPCAILASSLPRRDFSCPLALFESRRRAASLILWLKRSPGLNFSSFPLSFHHFMSVFKEGEVPCPSHPLLFGERSCRFPSSAESSLSEVGGTSACRVLSL